jgi:hypothetical protein
MELPRGTTKTEALLAQFPGPIVSYGCRLPLLVLAIVLVCGTIWLSAWLGRLLLTSTAIPLVLLLAFAWLFLIVVFPIQVVKRLPRLVLNSEGYETHSLVGVQRTQWREVASFSSILFLAFHRPSRSPRGLWEKMNHVRMWSCTFGLGANDFVRLMSKWRERALANFPPNAEK